MHKYFYFYQSFNLHTINYSQYYFNVELAILKEEKGEILS